MTPQGLDAHWRVSSLVTTAREQVVGLAGGEGDAAQNAAASAVRAHGALGVDVRAMPSGPLQTFDVSLAQPVDVYSMSTRAGKNTAHCSSAWC